MSALRDDGAGPQPKLVYLAKRNPGLNHEQFIRRWRQHGALAMGLQRWNSIERCAHCDALSAPPDLPQASGDYDGIGVIWFHDSLPGTEEDMVKLRADELETFSANVNQFALEVREQVVVDGHGRLKANYFAARSGDQSRAEFIARWMREPPDGVLPAAPASGLVRRLVQNEVCDTDRDTALEFDGYAEYWFENTADLVSFFADDADSPLRDPLIDQDRSVLVVSNEVLIYDFTPDGQAREP